MLQQRMKFDEDSTLRTKKSSPFIITNSWNQSIALVTLFTSRQVQTFQHYENSAYCFVTENLLPPNHLQQTACIPKLICYFRPQQLTFKVKKFIILYRRKSVNETIPRDWF